MKTGKEPLKPNVYVSFGVAYKQLTRSSEGVPVLRLLASGTKMDSAQYQYMGVDVIGEKVMPELLATMAEEAKAGGVYLLESHGASLPLGHSVDAMVTVANDGITQELYVDFVLDEECDLVKTLLRRMGEGYEPQCSVGLFVRRVVEYDAEEGGYVGKLVEGHFEHVAFTRPGHAAYPDADIEEVFLTEDLAAATKALIESTGRRIIEYDESQKAAMRFLTRFESGPRKQESR